MASLEGEVVATLAGLPAGTSSVIAAWQTVFSFVESGSAAPSFATAVFSSSSTKASSERFVAANRHYAPQSTTKI